jgi:hypothetical protein
VRRPISFAVASAAQVFERLAEREPEPEMIGELVTCLQKRLDETER